ncbi:MAG: protein-L-isoaspartate(D-aspartate) O-methyltransferase [Candidatus Hatepunaea meridiana]|nr:protein-L-isoaspartate(D-aspartate) O-methyltransferase [Candidatus Hatepunaea meridiana]
MSKDDRITLMVKQQLESRGITDQRLLDAMRKIERHLFVNKRDEVFAYDDRPLQIGSGQTISQPYMVAIMTEILDLKGEERIIEIGTGSGYQTAILAELGKEVFTIERIDVLLNRAKKILINLNYNNIEFKVGDGTIGWKEKAPFDRIIITAAAPNIPEMLFDQLAVGGRMVVPVGKRFHQDLKLIVRMQDGEQKVMSRGGCLFVPLIGEDGWQND